MPPIRAIRPPPRPPTGPGAANRPVLRQETLPAAAVEEAVRFCEQESLLMKIYHAKPDGSTGMSSVGEFLYDHEQAAFFANCGEFPYYPDDSLTQSMLGTCGAIGVRHATRAGAARAAAVRGTSTRARQHSERAANTACGVYACPSPLNRTQTRQQLQLYALARTSSIASRRTTPRPSRHCAPTRLSARPTTPTGW